MATIDLGKIKLVNRGAYNNSTAYTVDDLVQSGGSTYICIQNSTGNAVTNNSYWSVLAQGGTDVGTTITTQGDILYRDGSGLQRLAAGTSGQFLKTQGSGANPVWADNAGTMVKLVDQEIDNTGASSFEFQNIFSASNDTAYKGGYMWTLYSAYTASSEGIRMRFLKSTNTEISGSTDYTRAGVEGYRQVNQSSNTAGPSNDGDGRNDMDIDGWGSNNAGDYTEGFNAHGFILGKMYGGTDRRRTLTSISKGQDNSNPDYIVHRSITYSLHTSDNVTGLKIYINSGNLIKGHFNLWGLK